MRRRTAATATLVLAALGLLAGCLGGPGAIETAFDGGAEGWTVTGDAQSGSAAPTHHAEGGHPGGYVSADDDTQGGVWYWNASSAYLGDRSAFDGGTLSFDLRQSSTSRQFQDADVVLRSEAAGTLVHDFGDASEHPGENWTQYEIPLEPRAWRVGAEGEGGAANETVFEDVLGDLDRIWIRGEYVTGSDTGGLDDVRMAP